MSKFKWLNDCQELLEETELLELNLVRTKKELARWVHGDLSRYKLLPESDGARREEKLAAVQYELACKMNDLYDLKKVITRFKGIENKIMYHKYVEGMTLEKIAEKYNYSPQYVYNKHAQIKKMMQFAKVVAN